MSHVEGAGADYPRKRTAIAVSLGGEIASQFFLFVLTRSCSVRYVELAGVNATRKNLLARNVSN